MIFPKLHIELERWKWNKTYQLYVSTFGNFRDRQKIPARVLTTNSGYLTVRTSPNKRLVSAHRIVMETWCPCSNMKELTVDHLDHNKRNNRLKNLEWVTKKENQLRAKADFIPPESTKKNQVNKIQTIISENTLRHFQLAVNGFYFTTLEEVLYYVRTSQNLPTVSIEGVAAVYKTLINAYKHNNPEYVNNGFIKEKFGCEFSITKKGE